MRFGAKACRRTTPRPAQKPHDLGELDLFGCLGVLHGLNGLLLQGVFERDREVVAVGRGVRRRLRSTSPLTTSAIRASVSVCICENAPSAIASGMYSGLFSRISSAMRLFVTITSTAATRPVLARGSNRWLTTPLRTPARIERTCGCLIAGKNSTRRPTVSAASTVCMVESTRCPDSAAWSAVSAVSASRSSPIRMMSGSWRSTRRRASWNESVSSPTSRWLMMQLDVGVQDLDRILDRDDVLPPGAIDVVENGCERRGLARAGRAGHEHEAAVLLGEPLDPGRQPQRLEARNLSRDDAERERDVTALPEGVDAEARQARPLVGRVELAGLLEVREPRRRVGADLVQDLLEALRIERRPVLERLEVAVEADDRRLPDLEVDVARAEVDGGVQEAIQVHALLIGSTSAGS